MLPNSRHLYVGAAVEVRSNEDGFIGGWFEGTITHSFPKTHRFTITYSSLVADNASRKPLVETLYRSFIRPRPPPPDPGAVFEVHQAVEAYHNEAWWKGVVVGVPRGGEGGGLYTVCFPASREEFELRKEEVRPQREWAKGEWVNVEDQGGKDVMFDVGARVEVSRDKEIFGATWFVGTILKVIAKTSFWVEFENLWVDNDDGSKMLLREIVDLQYIRPCPPASEYTSFAVHDRVEGFKKHCWFPGLILEILPGHRYTVEYKYKKKVVRLDQTSLRPHLDWTDGSWIDISRDNHGKSCRLRASKSSDRRRKSNFRKRNTSLLLTSLTDSDGADEPKKSKKEENKHTAEGQINSFKACKESSKANGTFQDKSNKALASSGTKSAGPKQKSFTGRRLDFPISMTSFSSSGGSDVNLKCSSGVVQDKSNKTLASGETNSSGHKRKSVTGRKPDHPLPMPSFSHGNESNNVTLKCMKKASGLSSSANGLFQDKSNEALASSITKSAGRKRKTSAGRRYDLRISMQPFSLADGSDDTNLKSMGASGPCLEGGAGFSQPCKKLKLKLKEPSFDERNMINSSPGSKKSEQAKSSEEHLEQEDDSSLMAACAFKTHKRPCSIKGTPSCKIGPKSLSLFSEELVQGQAVTSRVNGTDKSIVYGKGSSRCMGEDLETNQSKKTNLCLSFVGHEDSDNDLVGDWGNCDGHSRPSNTKMRRKKLVSRSLHKHRKASTILAEEKELDGCRPPVKKVTCVNGGMESEQLEETTELVVGCENKVNLVDLSNQTPNADHQEKATEGEKSMLIADTEGESAAYDAVNRYLSNNLADITEDSHVTPQMESSTAGPKFLKYSKVQQSPILKFLNSKFEENCALPSGLMKTVDAAAVHVLPSKDHDIHDRDELNPHVPPSDKVVEMDRTTIAPIATEPSSPSNKLCDRNMLTPNILLFGKATVDIKDKGSFDRSPCGSSLSREDSVAVRNEPSSTGSSLGRTVFEKLEIEKEKASSESTPTWSLLSNKEIGHCSELVPSALTSGALLSNKEIGHCSELVPSALTSGVPNSSFNRTEEIHSCNGLAGTAVGEREKKAAKETVNTEMDKFALTEASSSRDIIMDNDNAIFLTDSSLQGSMSDKTSLPFTRKSELWSLVESREVFRILPQQPHFRTLQKCAKEFREGMAIGLMESFASMVTDISSLHISDSKQTFEEKLKALAHLENNGFNIQPVRVRLEKLLETHIKRSQSEGEKLYLKAKVLELEAENERKSHLVSSLGKAISELEKNLTILKEKKASMDLETRKSESEIIDLKTGVQAAEEASISAEFHFNAALAEPW